MTINEQTVLVAIDLNDETLFRLERSYPNLNVLAGKVILLYVFDNLGSVSSDAEKNRIVSEKNELLVKMANDITAKTGLEVWPVIQKGKVAEEILKAADSYNANLIALSSNTQPTSEPNMKNRLGSNTGKIVRESPVPVFTFNNNVILNKVDKILLPLDLTVETRQKVTNALQLAHNFDASIHIVSVLWSQRYEDIRNELQGQLDRVKTFIEEDNISCTAELLTTKGGAKMLPSTIVDYADEVGADLIMIMTQQENKLVEFFVGSAAQTIIRLAKVPVMSIIPKELGLLRIG